jgi:hypothetical protein
MFQSTKRDLREILRDARDGRLQLPDFQRSYVWADPDVRSLIASIGRGFPVGALLTLETGGEVRFKPRPIEGVVAERAPDVLLLDGQQRITSLYHALMSPAPIRTRTEKGKEVQRYYYLDIAKSIDLSSRMEDAVVSVDENLRMVGSFGEAIFDLSKEKAEFERHLFPLNKSFDEREWFYKWRDHWRERGCDVFELDRDFHQKVLDRIQRYEMPIIALDRSNSREAICLVFEKVNVGGKKLDAFELVTAIYAADEYNLREDWWGVQRDQGRHHRLLHGANRRDVLKEVTSLAFLQACTLLHTREERLRRARDGRDPSPVTMTRDAVLALPLDSYRSHADRVERGFIAAAEFLNERKIIWHRDVPYPPQLIALAALFAVLDGRAANAAARTRIARWFWSTTFGELYGASTESRVARDVMELADWILTDGPEPRTFYEAQFRRGRLLTLRGRHSAAFKGLHALLMHVGCQDFIDGQPTDLMTFFNKSIDVHHVFPKAWCRSRGLDPARFNSIINKTPLSAETNRRIGGRAPSQYLRTIERDSGMTPAELDDIIRTHRIEPEYLRNDDFEGFFRSREAALLELIEDEIGKPVINADDFDADASADDDDEDEAA